MITKNRLCICSFVAASLLVFISTSCKKDNEGDLEKTVTDIDGNVYNTITIGTQVWMSENLKTTKYRNGDPLPNITNEIQWANLSTGAYSNYNNLKSNSYVYGRLYNWYAVTDPRNIAPEGWHVPTDNEWTILEIYLQNNGFNFNNFIDSDSDRLTNNNIALSMASGMSWGISTVGGAVGDTNYVEIRNKSNFSALPSGYRWSDGMFNLMGIGYGSYWWSISEYSVYDSWYRFLYYDYSHVTRNHFNKLSGFSIRCIRD